MAYSLPDPYHDAGFYASVPAKRAVAWGVDTVISAGLTAIIVPFTAFTAVFFLPLLYVMVSAVYRWAMLSRASATLGMMLVAIEFRRADARPFDTVTAAVHTAGFMVSSALILPQVISAILMLTTPRGQGLTDCLLGTVAINRAARF